MYYDDGSVHTITRYADDGGTLVATSTYGYDGMARLTSLNHTQGGPILDDYTFSYDPASNMTATTSTLDGATGYTGYDAADN